ncbi:MAG: Gfo/Idh/MocA family oxidoreductase [Burkholderiaceae bacterium]
MLKTDEPVRLGVCGLGRAFVLTQAALESDPRIRMVAACAPRQASRAAFETRFEGAKAYPDLASLCADGNVDAIYIATPHGLHADQVCQAARAGKHLLVEKPLAVSLQDAHRMIAAVNEAKVHAIVGPSHSFDAPVAQASAMIASGCLGEVRMIQAFNYTDFLYRPRRPEELRTAEGGGVVFSQGIHQVDVVRRLAGRRAESVYACTGNWDAQRDTEGAYLAIIRFAGGLSASLTYSGYAHFDSDEWMGWMGELGHPKAPDDYGRARQALRQVSTPEQEVLLKSQRTFGAAAQPPATQAEEHFGPVIVSLDQADLRLNASGVHVYGDVAKRFEPVPDQRTPRTGVVDALVKAVRQDDAPLQSLDWGLASLEICHAMLESASSGMPVSLKHQ